MQRSRGRGASRALSFWPMGLFQLVEHAAYLSYLVRTIYKSAWALSSRQQHLLLAPTRLQSPSHDRNKLGAGLNLPLGGSIKRLPSWNPSGMMMAALQQLQLQGSNPWVLNTGTTSHMSSSDGILQLYSLPLFHYCWQ